MIYFKYFIIIICFVLCYELLRAIISKILHRRFSKSVKLFIKKYNIKLNDFIFVHKFMIRNELLDNNDIREGAVTYAHENGIRIQEAEEMVERYIDEIVPFFSITYYYKLGMKIAGFVVNLLYNVIIDDRNMKNLKDIPQNNAIVFVINHKSNIDYFLLSFVLIRHFIISFAAGEWARIWPLENLVKLFGAYFIRRKFRNKLYNTVLQKYVQLISMKGVTQGVFIEGALSRDGNFREPKIGILNNIIEIVNSPDFTNDILFVPVGINYDWILEDRILIKEGKKKKDKTGFLANFPSILKIAFTIPLLTLTNMFKLLAGISIKYGQTSAYFGEPVSINDFLRNQKKNIFSLERPERLSVVKQFADKLLYNIGNSIPVMPVTLVAKSITILNKNSFSKDELIVAVTKLYVSLLSDGRNIIVNTSYKQLDDIPDFSSKVENTDEVEVCLNDDVCSIITAALSILQKRNIIRKNNGSISIVTKRKQFIEYYGNAINHFFPDFE